MKKVMIALVFLLMIGFSFAANLGGTVYDDLLNKVNAKVEIREPLQRMVAENGRYNFELVNGNYTIRAEYFKGNDIYVAEENVTIQNNNDHVLDLILFNEINDEILDTGDFSIDPVLEDEAQSNRLYYNIIAVIVVLLIIAIVMFILFRKKKAKHIKHDKKEQKTAEKEYISDEYTKQVLDFIKKENGRTTQKDLRKEIPLSEGKISLIVAELEKEGKIKKIKKGRGNIIVLK